MTGELSAGTILSALSDHAVDFIVIGGNFVLDTDGGASTSSRRWSRISPTPSSRETPLTVEVIGRRIRVCGYEDRLDLKRLREARS